MDPVERVFLKHVIVSISTFVEWEHLKILWFMMKMVVTQNDNILLKAIFM